ncbi:MAG: hypothetical protein ACOC2U_01115, partial [bacterium]
MKTFTKYPFGAADLLNTLYAVDDEVNIKIRNTHTFVNIVVEDDTEIFCTIPNYFDKGSELFIKFNIVNDSIINLTDGFEEKTFQLRIEDKNVYLGFIYDGIKFVSYDTLEFHKNKYQKYINHKAQLPHYTGMTTSGTSLLLYDD